jgi:hypothetical protein
MNLLDYPIPLSILSFLALWLASRVGVYIGKTRVKLVEIERDDLGVILNAALTLLALVIGFSFSMATGRYDQRKNYEEEEANAIGTEYVRATLLPAADAARTRALLKRYLDQRIISYTTRDAVQFDRINATTSQLQNDLWAAIQAPCLAQPTPVAALIVSGMNDVLNTQGYTQAAWWNRIPIGAWVLMIAIGIFCELLFGYNANLAVRRGLFFVLPLIIAVAFFLLADLDSPKGGLIRVLPKNLISLSSSLGSQ